MWKKRKNNNISYTKYTNILKHFERQNFCFKGEKLELTLYSVYTFFTVWLMHFSLMWYYLQIKKKKTEIIKTF